MAKLAISTVKPYAIQKNITISLNCDRELKLKMIQDDLEIILNNLLSNAVKYNNEDGEVILNIHFEKNSLIIRVDDTGIGMTEDEISQLFKEFVRIKNEKTKKILGSGLGLSIVRKISDIYNGEISVESEPDKGSSFIIKLPIPE